MTREEAIRLMAGYQAMSASIAAVGDFGSYLTDKRERQQVATGLGKVVAAIYEECMRPVILQYPDLDPDKDRSSRAV
jgi:hypothetical protein